MELIKSQEKTVEQALEALRQSQARLDNGAGTQLDVLNARLQLTQAQSTVLQAWFAYQQAMANLRKATGESVRFLKGQLTDAATPAPAPAKAFRGMGK
jgi:outer membrane protein TolC